MMIKIMITNVIVINIMITKVMITKITIIKVMIIFVTIYPQLLPFPNGTMLKLSQIPHKTFQIISVEVIEILDCFCVTTKQANDNLISHSLTFLLSI